MPRPVNDPHSTAGDFAQQFIVIQGATDIGRIETTDSDDPFSVGLVYGPSGSGKSSLIKAGLLPRLSDQVLPVYIEATQHDTEARLLNALRKHYPHLDDDRSVKEALAVLRRDQGVPEGRKVLIVLDQFEQWLHANRERENTELVQALRQCDGSRIQCLVMLKKDLFGVSTELASR